MLSADFGTPPSELRQAYVCNAASVVVFGVVDRQKVLLNARRTAVFAIHTIRVTESVVGVGPTPTLEVGTAGGRAFVGTDVFETALSGEVPLQGVETLFFLYRYEGLGSGYRIFFMAEPFQGRFSFLDLEGSRSEVAKQLRTDASECRPPRGQ
jgi:hypothetical protein